ncbi:MAG: TonB-dependent receptor [Lutibacter sp.]|uniref:TonB-dependent receptor n=1 Tax=Lutibacter sp. TaxID=1925666 RepID=UPI00184C052F|nr:TonB-dependent receptor [Lutibacter sp.]MBT8316476.1 TonB-dependent receptor [Lutibacter sp.]NNJ57336.1 TonB-dependent receptor [Lutibacter sp.]
MLKKIVLVSLFLMNLSTVFAQTSTIKGRVFNSINNESIAFASIVIDSTSVGTTSDIDGNYQIENLKPGTYNVVCSFLGFKKKVFYEVRVTSTRTTTLDFALVEESTALDEILISKSPFNRPEESPVSVRTIGASEIYRNPGSNRDISKVIQILPGVASSVSFRNDIIVRGGAPNENRFYLDGIEIPNINHFATQGSSGGPVGMINVNFIQEVDFYAGAFPANRGNSLSSVMEFKQIEGNDEKLRGSLMVGSSDIGLTLDGPIDEKSTFIFSARRSYLQLLFKALNLPFLPTYNDFQYKQTIKVDDKNRVTIIGLGAIDDFELNKDVNDGLDDEEDIKRNNYILGNLPVNKQWNYTVGANWKHFASNSFQNFVISRNHLSNSAIKYQGNIEQQDLLLLDYNSEEIENKLRIENTYRKNGWKWNLGIGFENATYKNSTFNKIELDGAISTIDFDSELKLNKYALFSQLSKEFFNDRLLLSFGFRTDFNDYSNEMNNPIKQFSPRFSASYTLIEDFNFNFNIGRYFQLPAYTVMGYRDNSNVLVNKENNITYISANHLIAGLEYNPTRLSKITLEGFIKNYDNYPFLLRDRISLANLGGDFGVIGNEPATSTSIGKTYGVEFLVQQKLSSSIYGILSYTFVKSEFSNNDNELTPSSWDNRHILNITAGKKFNKGWEMGLKFRYLGGAPFTPYDIELSSTAAIWDVNQQGIFDYDRINQERNPDAHFLDLRIDKQWYFNKWAFNLYVDIQNVYNFQAEGQPFIDVERDASGNPVVDPTNPSAYKVSEIENTNGTVLPSIGIMIEF